MHLRWLLRKQVASKKEEEKPVVGYVEIFKKKMEENEDLIYGMALFFECINLLHKGHPIVETYRKQFRNIIRSGRELLDRASKLLFDYEKATASIQELETFDFDFLKNYPDAEENRIRAVVFSETYEKLFPDRPREKEFSDEEILLILEEAVKRFSRINREKKN